MNYVRFVVSDIDEDSKQRQGIFQALKVLKESDRLFDYEIDILVELTNWFDIHLESPLDHLNTQRLDKSYQCISWFKSSATEHIQKIREVTYLLQNREIQVEKLISSSPGKIVYEDDYQIFAKPYEKF